MKRIFSILLTVLMVFSMIVSSDVKASEITQPANKSRITSKSMRNMDSVSKLSDGYAMLNGNDIWIENDYTFTENTWIPEGTSVYIAENATVTVASGIELCIQGYVEVYGALIFEENSILTISGHYVKYINVWSGKLDVTGADISGVPYGSVAFQLNSSAEIKGIPDEMLYAQMYVFDTNDINEALSCASDYFYFDIISASSFTLTNSITLPENTEWIHWKYQSADTPDHTVIVPSGVTVINNGWLTVDSDTSMIFKAGSTLVNNKSVWTGGILDFSGTAVNASTGIITVSGTLNVNGTLNCDGTFVVEEDGSVNVDNGGTAYLNNTVVNDGTIRIFSGAVILDDTDWSGYEPVTGVASSVPMYRMYDPNSGEHFYTGSTEERDFLVEVGWHYEGVGFNFPAEGDPVYRLYEPVYGEHLYTMNEAEKKKLLSWGWQYEGVAFNSAGIDEVPQYRLRNPNAKRGGYHFTGSEKECQDLINVGWIYEGIGWYSCLK